MLTKRHDSLPADQLCAALAVRDLTDPGQGPHALQVVLDDVTAALAARWGVAVHVHRALPVVSARDNYDRLYYPPEGVARDARYTRWLGRDVLLRTQTSAMIPALLDRLGRELAEAAPDALLGGAGDVLLACPGVVYRRDSIDRLHVGEPHQLDVWRLRRGAALDAGDLDAMIDAVVAAVLPGWRYRAVATAHPYTVGGRQIDVEADGAWIEIGECGLAHPALIADAGLPADVSGLAMGLGLDRLLMLRKGLDDIRLLRSRDPRIASQLLDLAPYRPVSVMPPVRRDLSIVVDGDADGDGELDAEGLGDQVRAALGDRAAAVEEVAILSTTSYDALPAAARERLGIAPGQSNLLVRVVLRDLDRTLTHEEANALRDAIYAALHRGAVHHWASPEGGRRSLPW